MQTQKEVQALKEAKIEALRDNAKKALNRGERHVANVTLNKILATYKELGYKKLDDIIEHLSEVKPAKSIEDLQYNIVKNLKAGTRGDGQKVDLEEIELF